jgi:hypothetical protein
MAVKPRRHRVTSMMTRQRLPLRNCRGERRRLELAVTWLSAATAVNAFGGAVYGWNGAPGVPREWLRGSPFEDYRVPGVILGAGVGGTAAVAAAAAWRGSAPEAPASILAGGVLTGWIVIQVAVIGLRSGLQPAMAAVGVSLIGLGRRLSVVNTGERRRRRTCIQPEQEW